MRLIRITTNYHSYLKQFYVQHPELKAKSYEVQYQTLMSDCFAWVDSWTRSLAPLGYEVWEPVANAEPMQKAWAQENNVGYQEENWLLDIIAAQVKCFQPDILFVHDYSTFSAEFLNQLRQQCSSIRLVLGYCGAPGSDDSVFHAYDVVLSCHPGLVDHFRSNGHRGTYLRHAFEPRILDRLDRTPKQTIDFSFIGSIIKGKKFHHQREQLLKQLIQQTDLQIWADISKPSPQELQKLPFRQAAYDLIQMVKSLPGSQSLLATLPKLKTYASLEQRPDLSGYIDAAIADRAHPALFGLSMFQKLFESRITLNTHIDLAGPFAVNMRLYEATGVGTCLLTDWKPTLHELFEPDREVVTYQSPEECVEKVKWLLEHPQERETIARAGQARTLKEHTFTQRAMQLDEIIQVNIPLTAHV